MKVKLRELPADRHIDLAPAFLRDILAGMNPDPGAGSGAAPGEITADLSITEEHGTVFADGSLTGWIGVTCSRCLGTARLTIDEPFRVTFLPHAEGEDEDEEVELNQDDLDVASYHGDEIDLEPPLREQILLAVPIAPLCDEQCKGLCPLCGADRNQGECGCPEQTVDPRWSALKNLKQPG
jgi:uncharacterized protein